MPFAIFALGKLGHGNFLQVSVHSLTPLLANPVLAHGAQCAPQPET